MNQTLAPLAVDIPTACRIIGVARSTLYKEFRAGTIIPRKAGKKTLILTSDIEAYVASLPTAPMSQVAD